MGFTAPAALTLPAGATSTIEVAARNTTAAPQTVTWELPAQDGITFEPSRGTLTLDASGAASQTVTVRASSLAIPGDHVIRVHMVADSGAAMPLVVIKLTVPAA